MGRNSFLKITPLQTPRKILFGVGATSKLGHELRMLGAKKILLVTDKVVRKVDLVSKLIHNLENEGFEIVVYDEIKREPCLEGLEEVAGFARKTAFEAVVGIGGGSVLDTAKVAAMSATNPGNIHEYVGVNLVKEHGKPLVLMPTTSGTGSEVSQAVVLTINGVKVAIWSPKLFADVAIVDPLMTVSMPRKLTATTAIDALSHAIEAMMSLDSTPLTDAIAKDSIRLIGKFLRVAYRNGRNLEARSGLSLAATMAGVAFSNAGLCAGHAIAYTFASDYKLPHGVSCALALPYIMAFNLPMCTEKFLAIAEAMGVDVKEEPQIVSARKAITEVVSLIRDVGLPTSLKEIGMPKGDISTYAEALLTKYGRLLPRNPRKISIEDSVSIFEKMWEGEI